MVHKQVMYVRDNILLTKGAYPVPGRREYVQSHTLHKKLGIDDGVNFPSVKKIQRARELSRNDNHMELSH